MIPRHAEPLLTNLMQPHNVWHMDELLTSAEACKALAVDRSTLSRWVASERLTPARKMPGIRGAFLFNRADVVALAEELAA